MSLFFKKVIFPILCLIVIFIISLHFFTNNHNSKNSVTNYILKAHKNTVALYYDEQIIKTYSDIVLNTLPESDIQNFKKGISFSTTAQADIYLEDFE